jgi:hypothetical protein
MAAVEELAAGLVEVVGVVFVGEEDGVDGGDVWEGEGGREGGAEGVVAEGPFAARGGEDGVGDEVDVGEVDYGCGGSDLGNEC